MSRSMNGFLALILVLSAGAAQASKPTGTILTGQVTAVTASSITVNGTTYEVPETGPVAEALHGVQVGQSVTVQLNGSAGSPSAQVLSIQSATDTSGSMPAVTTPPSRTRR